MSKREYVRKLPAVLQTDTNKKFFSATFDQLLSERNSEMLDGFIGRRPGGYYEPEQDFYVSEATRNRTNYQLEPIALSKDPATFEDEDQVFYEDILNTIRFYGGHINNHDRLFQSAYYSYAPPIDIDKFLNYQHYFWLPDLTSYDAIPILGLSDTNINDDIIGQLSFNTRATVTVDVVAGVVSNPLIVWSGSGYIDALGETLTLSTTADGGDGGAEISYNIIDGQMTDLIMVSGGTGYTDGTTVDVIDVPNAVEFSSGLLVQFDDIATVYANKKYRVEGVGRLMTLVPVQNKSLPFEQFEWIPWDFNGDAATHTGPEPWDSLPWDAQLANLSNDYITIERGACDQNGWSRTNAWYHKDVLNENNRVTGQAFPVEAVRAKRPIIEFTRDLELFNSGQIFLQNINLLAIDTDGDVSTPVSFSSIDGENLYSFNTKLDGKYIVDKDLIVFTEVLPGDAASVVDHIWEVQVTSNVISLVSVNTASVDDIILIKEGDLNSGATYYRTGDGWSRAESEKFGKNRSPLFQLYDCAGVKLNDDSEYPEHNFIGSAIFSYKEDETSTTRDSELGFPLTYTGLGQISDIVFENDLETERWLYVVSRSGIEIPGYYFFKDKHPDISCTFNSTLETSWYPAGESKQRVIDRYIVEDITNNVFNLSVLPYQHDVVVKIDGRIVELENYTINNNYVVVHSTLSLNQVVEFFTYARETSQETFTVTDIDEVYYRLAKTPTYPDFSIVGSVSGTITDFTVANKYIVFGSAALPLSLGETLTVDYISTDNLTDTARGYYEIPQSLENNPMQEEITEHSYNDFAQHFISILENQDNINSVQLGENNLYRDSEKDISRGTFILQNVAPLLKAMFITSNDDVNFIKATRFAGQEYNRFKNKFAKTVYDMLQNNEFAGINDPDNSVRLDAWFNEVVRRVNQTSEVTSTFNNGHMIALGTVYQEDVIDLPGGVDDGFGNITVELTAYDDITDPVNTLYLFSQDNDLPIEEGEQVLVDVADYEVLSTDFPITIEIKSGIAGNASIDNIYARVYSDPISSHIASTPSKMGMYPLYIPAFLTDTMSPTPDTSVGALKTISGHDGSVIPQYGDLRDTLLYELEKRIYNGTSSAFKGDYQPLFVYEDFYPGAFRDTDYTVEEINEIMQISFNKWCNALRINWRTNDLYNINDEWTYNYRDFGVNETNTPGLWKGIFRFYYDTEIPHLAPWEMLGFRVQPLWWESEYTTDYSSANTAMWDDIEAGVIAAGDRIGTDERYTRPGLVASYLPVDALGNIRSPVDIGLTIIPPLDSDKARDWQYGDHAQAEDVWIGSSLYPFALMELFYLTKPAKFGEELWETTEATRAGANRNQIVSVRTCKRSKNQDQHVHGEVIDNVVQVRTGYQRWISDRLAFLRKSIKTNFGDKIRLINTKLGHKMGGYTVDDTFKLFLESVSTESSSTSALFPAESTQIEIRKGPSIKDYVYSGVIVRALGTGQYQVYGYDILESKFRAFPAIEHSRAYEVNVGGDDEPFREFLLEEYYRNGEYVRYNTVYYRCKEDHFATKFDIELWTKVSKLPSNGGVETTYYADRNPDITNTYLYGHIFDSMDETFDFLIGYGAYLESEGWAFDTVDTDKGVINNFLEAGKQYMFWVATSWSPNNVIALSPAAQRPKLVVAQGYPENVERTNNGVYSILDEEGVLIDPRLTVINRDDDTIEVLPVEADIRIYYLRVSAAETEHVFTIENVTTFNDVMYDPQMGTRQPRIQISAPRTLDWIGKYEAPGYIITEDKKLIPNLENTTESIRRYHDTETALDTEEVENVARHLIGYEEKGYLVDLQLDDDVQYQFYQGAIRQKGTEASIRKLLRSIYVTQEQDINTYEEWALKLYDYGGICENQSFDIVLSPGDAKTDPQLLILDTPSTRSGYVKEILVINTGQIWDTPPIVYIERHSSDCGNGGGATAIAVLNDINILDHIVVTHPGDGYQKAPYVYLGESAWDTSAWDSLPWDIGTNDKALAVLQFDITEDNVSDDIIMVDVDDTDRWAYRPRSCGLTNLLPTTDIIKYNLPNAGYAHLSDVDYTLYHASEFNTLWSSNSPFKPIIEQSATYDPDTDLVTWTDGKRQLIWIASGLTGDWNIYRTVDSDSDYGTTFVFITDDTGTFIESSFEYITDLDDLRFISGSIVLNVRQVIQTEPLRTVIENTRYTIEQIQKIGLVTNGSFDTDTNWNKGVGWTIIRAAVAATTEDGGSGYSISDTLTVIGGTGTAATLTVTDVATITAQDETDYAANFTGGADYAIADVIVMDDGSSITVNNVSTGAITEFTVTTNSISGLSEGATITQVTTDGIGTGFDMTLVVANQEIFLVNVTTPGAYTTDISNPASTTGGGGTDAAFNVSLSNVASSSGIQTAESDLTQGINIVAGENYNVSFAILNYGGGTITPVLGAEGIGTDITANGHYTQTITAGQSNTTLAFRADANFVGNIDNVEVVPSGTFKYLYRILDDAGESVTIEQSLIDSLDTDPTYEASIWYFASMRFPSEDHRDNFGNEFGEAFIPLEYSWIDSNADNKWEVQILDDSNDPAIWIPLTLTANENGEEILVTRTQDLLVDTHKFKQAFIYETSDTETDFMLPVYDPFKGILPGPAGQNISWMTETDPARYSVASSEGLVDENNLFGRIQAGQLWWDTTNMRYMYYEQGTNRERRDQWGLLFPGSIIDVYEWTRSIYPPSSYNGDGSVRNTTDYAVFVEYDSTLQKELNVYYFWVKDKLDTPPNIKHRTISSKAVGLLLSDPRSYNYQWFSPVNWHHNDYIPQRYLITFTMQIGQTTYTMPAEHFECYEIRSNGDALTENTDYFISNDIIIFVPGDNTDPGINIEIDYIVTTTHDDRNAFIFNNINAHIANSDSVFQVNYSYQDEDHPDHTDWHLVREGDEDAVILEQHWRKMADSLLGQTDIIEWTTEVPGFCSTSNGEGFLIVPDPMLGDYERYGSKFRPRQTWFKDSALAREIFVNSVNGLLASICVRDEIPEWAETFDPNDLDDSEVWQWIDWYADGYNVANAKPSRQVDGVGQLTALMNLVHNEIIKVVSGDYYTLYRYDATSSDNTFTVIGREKCAVELQSILYTIQPPQVARTIEARQVIDFIEQYVFVNTDAIKKNQIFFTMLNFAVSEDTNHDWVFKSTYLVMTQTGLDLEQHRFLQPDSTASTIDYVNSVKPYHTKVRDYSVSRNAGLELGVGTATELRNMMINLTFNRVACNTAAITANGFNYQVGDILLVVGGNPFIPMTLEVKAISYNNVIYTTPRDDLNIPMFGPLHTISVEVGGEYTHLPVESVPVIGISGTMRTATIVDNGDGYSVNDTLTVVGGIGDPAILQVLTGSGGLVTSVIILDQGDYTTNPINPVSVTGGTGTGVTFDLEFAGSGAMVELANVACDASDIIRDAATFVTPTYPWDSTDWDEHPWDGAMPINYYSASDGEQFDELIADQTIVSDGVTDTYVLTFTPTSNAIDDGPYVFVDGVQYYNFNYNSGTNDIVFFTAADIPVDQAIISLFDILPFDGAGFLQPGIAENMPEELVMLSPVEDLVITVDRGLMRCVVSVLGAGKQAWIPVTNLNVSSIVVYVNDVLVPPTDYIDIQHTWDDHPWDPTNGCEGPLWDTDNGIEFIISLDIGDVITIDYDLTVGTNPDPDPFKFKLHYDPMSNQAIYKLCDEETGELVNPVIYTDNEIELTNIGTTGFNTASLNNPGYVWVGKELVAYHEYDDSGANLILRNLVRGYQGTSVAETHAAGTVVFDAKEENIMPNINVLPEAEASTNDFTETQTDFLSQC